VLSYAANQQGIAMLKKLKRLFAGAAITNTEPVDSDEQRLAAIALMVEIIAVDYQQKASEEQALLVILQREFDIDKAAAKALVNQAEQARAAATDYYRFTAEINQRYSAEQKIALIETLWRLAWADEEIHQLEEHVIRRLASLLHVSHKDFIAAKLRVLEA
jgi:uncharacterized tellurite resistance protein B-like protein